MTITFIDTHLCKDFTLPKNNTVYFLQPVCSLWAVLYYALCKCLWKFIELWGTQL